MICPDCEKNEVTVHYTEIVDGKMVEYHLCEDCARRKGFALTPSDAMAELMGSLAAAREPGEDEGLACARCGLTLKELREAGRLGCGECYRTFAANLAPLLKALHQGERHIGKSPSAKASAARPEESEPRPARPGPAPEVETPEEEIERLRKEVGKAVAAEDYETAARLRDRIAELSAGPEGEEEPG